MLFFPIYFCSAWDQRHIVFLTAFTVAAFCGDGCYYLCFSRNPSPPALFTKNMRIRARVCRGMCWQPPGAHSCAESFTLLATAQLSSPVNFNIQKWNKTKYLVYRKRWSWYGCPIFLNTAMVKIPKQQHMSSAFLITETVLLCWRLCSPSLPVGTVDLLRSQTHWLRAVVKSPYC